jgi:hypothetical protein
LRLPAAFHTIWLVKKKVYLTFSIFLTMSLLHSPLRAAADANLSDIVPSPVMITEVQTGSASGSDEFIELYNASISAVDITGWQLRYSNANSQGDGTTLIAAIGSDTPVVVGPGEYYILHTASVPLPEGVSGQVYSAKLSSADKVIGLFAANVQTCQLAVVDALAWGTAAHGEGTPVTTSSSGEKLLTRLRVTDLAGYVDTANNAADFLSLAVVKGETVPQLAKASTPGGHTVQVAGYTENPVPGVPSDLLPVDIEDCELPTDDETEEPPLEIPDTTPPAVIQPDDDPDEPEGPVMPARNTGLVAPQLSELLPDPAKPQTDAADEFIELYNSNKAPYELSGFMLESGKKRYVFPQGTMLEPQSFKAFFSADTKVSLANTQGQVRLLDPFGRIISQSDPYQSAKDGQAWVSAQGKWQWTITPTPNALNAVKAPPAKKTTAKAKTAAAQASQGGISSTPKNSASQAVASVSTEPKITPLHPGVLALVGVFALLYGAYEYRGDVANKIYQLRRDRASRRENRQSPEGQ